MGRTRPRLADVAARAGVSITTVSHVVNRTRFVAAATRSAVERAIEELGYRSEQGERSSSTRAIGLVTTVASNPYFSEIIEGTESEARRHGYALLLCDSHDDPADEAGAVETLLAHRVEAVIPAPTPKWRTRTLPLLRKHNVPFILIDRTDSIRCDQISTENVAAAQAVVDHLIERGHRRIGMVSGLAGISTTDERIDGYEQAHRAAGLAVDPALVVSGNSTLDGARRAVADVLQLPDPPTAIFSANNAMTVGTLIAIRAAGRRIPQDMAVVAFDDVVGSEAFSPALTAVSQPFVAVGARAVQLLLRRIADPLAPRRVIRLPNEIEHRESCGCSRPSPDNAEPAALDGEVRRRAQRP